MQRKQGFTIAEMLVVVAILGMTAGMVTPAFVTINRHGAARAATSEIRSIFHFVRARAITRARHAGVKFTKSGGEWFYAVYDDGDGDGIRNDDITSGADTRLTAPKRVLLQARNAAIALPPISIKDPDGDPLTPASSPVQFNSSTICSFSPVGEATSGTIYLSDRVGEVWAVRVYGASGKIRLLRYDAGSRRWEAR
jgi:prepilin-type N-terminal cleavage/methylation domain-containing protein